jgi:aspartyl-tRNA(Asn)/glutamyl-tRNA(Gln) amidotransferase subunit A
LRRLIELLGDQLGILLQDQDGVGTGLCTRPAADNQRADRATTRHLHSLKPLGTRWSRLKRVTEILGLTGLVATHRAIVALESDITGMRKLAAGREMELSSSVRGLLTKDWKWEEFSDALTDRKRVVEAMRRLMARYDLLLTPTVPLLPFAVDLDGPGTIKGKSVEDDSWTPALFLFNLTGQPAASVPAGWSENGLPVGLQIVGGHLADATVLTAAATFEQARPWAQRRPEEFG